MEDYKQLGKQYRKDSLIPEATAKRMLKQAEVKPLIQQNLTEIMIALNITPEWTINKRQQIINKAMEYKQFNAANTALDRIESHLGLNNKITVTETHQTNSNLQQNFDNAKNDVKTTVQAEVNMPQMIKKDGETINEDAKTEQN